MTPAQSKAARALLKWRLSDLAMAGGVSMSTVADFEAGRRVPRAASMVAMRGALKEAGIELLEPGEASDARGVGVRLHASKAKRR
jgi:transcriptional regulator with XRE-family HTH domain